MWSVELKMLIGSSCWCF